MMLLDKLGYIFLFPILVLDMITDLLSRCFSLSEAPNKKGDKEGSSSSTSSSSFKSEARSSATETRGAPRSVTNGPLLEVYDTHRTMYEMMQGAIATYGTSRVAMRSRKFVEMKKLKDSDRFPTKIFDDEAGFDDINYSQLGERIQNFGSGLRKLGMTPIPDFEGLDEFNNLQGDFKMVLFEKTCAMWTIALQGAFSQSMTVATCYATLGDDAVVSAVQETEAAALMVNWNDVPKFVDRAKDMPSLKIIIASLNECGKGGFDASELKKKTNLKIVTTSEVLEMGKDAMYQPTPPKPSDVAVIMFTSGSTGKPKGVVMYHSHLIAGIAGMEQNVQLRPGQETVVSYLPLAHILALQVENGLLSKGATLCYTDPHDLAKALRMYKPTVFAGVPKVYEMLKSALEKKINTSGTVLRVIFNTLLSWKMFVLREGGDTPVTNQFFDLIVKKVFGGRLQFAISGGGPISSDLLYFSRACFNCPVVQGYALTETCVGGCFQSLQDNRTQVVGPPVSCVEVSLQSEPDLTDSNGKPYLHTDTVGTKGEAIIGRGEICMRGPSVAAGYFKNPQQTAENFDKEGFFHTGDIGQFTEDGVIQIIDRKKNLVKLKGGEYIAMEAMETAFAGSKYVEALCVVANGDLDVPLAIVLCNNNELEKWAKQEGESYDNLQELASRKKTRQEVVESMKKEGKKAGLSSLELRIKDCCIITDTEWKPGHGFTASMKLDRKSIHKIHAKELEAMYQRNGIKASS